MFKNIILLLFAGAVLAAALILFPTRKPAKITLVAKSHVAYYDPAAPFDPKILHFGKLMFMPPDNAPGMHVFFIGNSLTFVNDLPHMVAAVAASDSENPVTMQVGAFTNHSRTLQEMWDYKVAQSAIQSRHWDYVVLQEASTQAMYGESAADSAYAVGNWTNVIRAAGANPVIYEIWAKKPGSDWYEPAKHGGEDFVSADYMQGQIDDVTNSIAARYRIPVVPIGDYWMACSRMKGFPELYYLDGTHSSIAGDYLNALIFYRYLTGHDLSHITYVPIGVSPEEARIVKKCAAVPFSNGLK